MLLTADQRDEVWAGAISPRANRFILHRDENNPLVSSLEQFRAALPVFRPQLLVVGGLQVHREESYSLTTDSLFR